MSAGDADDDAQRARARAPRPTQRAHTHDDLVDWIASVSTRQKEATQRRALETVGHDDDQHVANALDYTDGRGLMPGQWSGNRPSSLVDDRGVPRTQFKA